MTYGFRYEIDELAPAHVAEAIKLRATTLNDLYTEDIKNASSEVNQAIYQLAARSWPVALIADKLGLDEQYVHIFCQSKINKARIQQIQLKLPENDPYNYHENENAMFRELVKLGKDRLVSLIRSDNDYVALSTLKEVANRGYGKPVEHVTVSHEMTLAGCLQQIEDNRHSAVDVIDV